MASLRVNPSALAHKDTHPAISPSRPELSQAGKTVLVTGGGSGVGYAIASGFARAGASAIILTGRREHVLKSAAEKLKADWATMNPGLAVHTHPVDVASSESIAALWSWLAETKTVIDVLVLNAGLQSPIKSMLQLGLDGVWEAFKANVQGHMDFAERFHNQGRPDASSPAVRSRIITCQATYIFLFTDILDRPLPRF